MTTTAASSPDRPTVLVCGGNRLTESVWSFARGFQRAGYRVLYLPTRAAGIDGQTLIVQTARFVKPDLLFWWQAKARDCAEGVVAAVKRVSPCTVTVDATIDDPYQIDLVKSQPNVARQFDLVATCCEGSVRTYKRLGINAVCVYPPCDVDLHGSARPAKAAAVDMEFAATNVYPTWKYDHVIADRGTIVRSLLDLGTIHLHGYWGEKQFDWGYEPNGLEGIKATCFKGFVPYNSLPVVWASARIVLCSHVRPDGYKYLNERIIEAMGAGAFVLTDHVAGMEELFTPGVHLDTWHDIGELRDKVRYWLDHDDDRRKVAETGQEHVLTWYNNHVAAETVLDAARLAVPIRAGSTGEVDNTPPPLQYGASKIVETTTEAKQ